MRKCGYCDFYSTPDLSLIPQWIKGLSREIRFRKQGGDNFYGFPSGQIDTLYFGGGTPSVLGIRDLEAVLGLVFSSCRIADHAEITLEANPGTLSGSYLADLRTLGVNRLSLGIQSLDPAKLEFLTRIHSVG